MVTEDAIWDVVDPYNKNGPLMNVRLNRVPNEDVYFIRFILLLRRPGESPLANFVVFYNLFITGPELASLDKNYIPTPDTDTGVIPRFDSYRKRIGIFIKSIEGKLQLAKQKMASEAMPYIEDGCVEIANRQEGPWTNLMIE